MKRIRLFFPVFLLPVFLVSLLLLPTGCDSPEHNPSEHGLPENRPRAGNGRAKNTPLRPIRTVSEWEAHRQAGRLPETIDRIYCSGGTLRLAVYLDCADKVVAVDENESRSRERVGMKAYLAAHPEFHDLPVAGESSGRDNPELLMNLNPPPQLIVKADTGAGFDPEELTRRTGIPVLLVPMRGITAGREEFDAALRLMGTALGKADRAETVLAFFDREIAAIKKRIRRLEQHDRPSAYVGGVAYNGAHAFHSSEAGYPPFDIAEANAPLKADAENPILGKRHTLLSREIILEWNPDILFLDLSTLYLGEAGGLAELRNDPAYRSLTAVQEGRIYALLPNTWYFVNHDAVLANAWFVAKILYPDRFEDIDPEKKANEIHAFLVGKPVFAQQDAALGNLVFQRISIGEP